MPIEMVLDDLEQCFNDVGLDVEFEVTGETSTYVYIINHDVFDIDSFYKKVTTATHNFAADVVPVDSVNIVTMNGSMYISITVVDPEA